MGNLYRYAVVSLIVLVLGFSVNSAWGNSFLVATFADPALDSSTPLFTVLYGTSGSVTGGWGDAQTGLDLEVPIISSNPFIDAFFEMTPLVYNGDATGGTTGNGTIKFFGDGDNPGTATPLVKIVFDSAQVNPGSLYGDNLFQLNNVDITVDGYSGVLSEEQFSFGFSNKVFIYPPSPGGAIGALMAPVEPIGFTVTTAFTSSAVPEPMTLGLLGFGSLVLLLRRRK